MEHLPVNSEKSNPSKEKPTNKADNKHHHLLGDFRKFIGQVDPIRRGRNGGGEQQTSSIGMAVVTPELPLQNLHRYRTTLTTSRHTTPRPQRVHVQTTNVAPIFKTPSLSFPVVRR